MEIDTLSGLPAHPLFVHIPVVLVPMAALGAIALAIFPRFIRRWGWWVVALAGVGALGAIFAASSGEAFEERVEETSALERHTELGEVARSVSIVLFIVLISLVLAQRFLNGNRLRTIAASAVVIAAAAGAVGTIAAAGHSGADSVWSEVVTNSDQIKDGDSGDRYDSDDDDGN